MVNLLDLSLEELKLEVTKLGEPSFRAKQLLSWLHKGYEFNEMVNMPKAFCQKLADNYFANPVVILEKLVSKEDGTTKFLYKLPDNNVIEGVLMKYKYGNTLCVSTQVGCRMGCVFCASGIDGLVRNLTSGEIIGQVVAVNRLLGGNLIDRKVTNVVLMGSGEPLDNYDSVTKFFKLLGEKDGLNISLRNVSLSTSGICPNIYRLADEGYQATLTISLHSPNDEYRSKIMPVNKKYPIEEVIKAAKYYFNKTGRRVIFEYCLIENVTDDLVFCAQLAKLVRGFPAHINLIRLNQISEKELKSVSDERATEFLNSLEKLGVSATIRRTMGRDIDGACGQLRRKYLKEGIVR